MSKIILKELTKPLSFLGVPFWLVGWNVILNTVALVFHRSIPSFMVSLLILHGYLAYKAFEDMYFHQVWLYRAEKLFKRTTSLYKVKGRRYAAR